MLKPSGRTRSIFPVQVPPHQKPAYSPTPRLLQPQSQRWTGPGFAPMQLAQSLMPSTTHPFDSSESSPVICVMPEGPKFWNSIQSESRGGTKSETSHETSIHRSMEEVVPYSPHCIAVSPQQRSWKQARTW